MILNQFLKIIKNFNEEFKQLYSERINFLYAAYFYD